MAPVALTLAVGVVLVDDDLLAGWQEPCRRGHRPQHDLLAGAVVQQALMGVRAFRRRQLGVGVVDVVAAAIGEHGVDQVGLDLGRERQVHRFAAGVVAGFAYWLVAGWSAGFWKPVFAPPPQHWPQQQSLPGAPPPPAS